MLDEYIEEQKLNYSVLNSEIKKQRLTHAYLFESNGYEKTFDFALAFAKALLCPKNFTNKNGCEKCMQCHNIDEGNFLELKIIEADGMWIKKEQLIELQEQFNTKSILGKRKVYIIKNAEKLNTVASNSLLKFLEEPEENIIAILITNSRYQLLDTIISRCQIISLNNSLSSNDSLELQIAKNLYNTTNEIEQFTNNEKNIEKIDKIVKFALFFEKNNINTLLYENEKWTSSFKTKEECNIAFEILLLYYRDILEYMCNNNIIIFKKYADDIETISKNSSIKKIVKTIDKIIEIKNYLKYNANTNLLLDKLIIELGR